MAVHQPGTGVISGVRNDKPTGCRQHGNITTGGVREPQSGDVGRRKVTSAGAKHIHVVTMKMDWVGDRWGTRGLLDDPIGPLSFISNIKVK